MHLIFCTSFYRVSLCLIFVFILGELTCERDLDLSWININTLKASNSITNKELPNNLAFTPHIVSLGDLYKTNKKLFIHFEAEIQQNEVSFFVGKTPEIPDISITEALMTSSTSSPKEKTGLYLGNIRQHISSLSFQNNINLECRELL